MSTVSYEKLILECTYVHVQSDLMSIGVRQNMHLFMTITSNICINQKIMGISLIIQEMHLFLLWRIMTEIQS